MNDQEKSLATKTPIESTSATLLQDETALQTQGDGDAFSEFNPQDKKLLIELLDSIIEEQGLYPIKE